MNNDKEKSGYQKRKERLNQTVSTMGKLPPQATDLEEKILGVLMLEKNALYEVVDLLKPEMFYIEANQNIYKAIITLHSNKNAFDYISVVAQLRLMGLLETVGGAFYIISLTDKVTGSEQIDFWSRIIMQKHLQREIIRECSQMVNESYEDTIDPFESLGKMSQFLSNAEMGFIGGNDKAVGDIATEVILKRENTQVNDNSIHGLETGIHALDVHLDGLQPGELIVWAGRPSMGKTAVIVSACAHMAIEKKEPIAVFSLEMKEGQIFLRIESNVSGINGKKIKQKSLSEAEYSILWHADNKISNSFLRIDDTSFMNVNQLIARIRRMVRKYGIKGVFIDYLQLLQGLAERGGNRESEISNMTRSLKVCAGALGIPINILCQLSRNVESRRPFCIPTLADLRESGAIEQDADKVIFLWRPEYYLTEQDQNDPKKNIGTTTHFRLFNKSISNKNLLVFIIAKHREGELGNIPALFHPWNARVLNHPDITQTDAFIDPTISQAEKETYNKINSFVKDEFTKNPDDDEEPF